MLKVTKKNFVEVNDWDDLVRKTYGKPYQFQQQDGCQMRGIFELTIPSEYSCDEDMNDSIPEVINGDIRGVKFDVWLDRDPKQPLPKSSSSMINFDIRLFWHRNFYPDIYTLANDLYEKGLIEKGEYVINIDW